MSRARVPEPRRRRERGDDGISWDRANKCYVGTISLGYNDAGKRLRRTARGKTKQAVKDKLDKLHEEIKAGIETPATYTVRQCVADWLDSRLDDNERARVEEEKAVALAELKEELQAAPDERWRAKLGLPCRDEARRILDGMSAEVWVRAA